MSVSVVSDEKWSQDEKVKNVITCDFPGKFLKNFTLAPRVVRLDGSEDRRREDR